MHRPMPVHFKKHYAHRRPFKMPVVPTLSRFLTPNDSHCQQSTHSQSIPNPTKSMIKAASVRIAVHIEQTRVLITAVRPSWAEVDFCSMLKQCYLGTEEGKHSGQKYA